jgi:hypothetical protein
MAENAELDQEGPFGVLCARYPGDGQAIRKASTDLQLKDQRQQDTLALIKLVERLEVAPT